MVAQSSIGETPLASTGKLSPPLVSLILVNYNGLAHIAECFTALREQSYPAGEVLMVDNNSSDNSVEFARQYFPSVKIIESKENLGYSGAVNLSLPLARGKYIGVMNIDTVVESDWLLPLISFLEEHPHVGAVTPKIVLYQDPGKINALGQNVHISGLGFNRKFNHAASTGDAVPIRVSGIHGAAFIIRRDLLERMGGMNADCFMYHEDVAISWMITLMGKEIYCVPASVIRHKYDLFMNPWKLYYLERNRMMLLLCNLQWWSFIVFGPMLLMTEAMMIAYCVRRGRDFLSAKMRSLVWNLQNFRLVRERRSRIQSLRARSDWAIVRTLRLQYDWDQLLKLVR